MKKLILFCLSLIIIVTASAEKYKIVKLSTKTIIIGGKTCKEGSLFSDSETIIWSSDEQGFWARNIEKGTYNYFAAQAFQSRKSKTAFEYLRTNKMSTRSGGFDLTLQHSSESAINERRIALVIGNANYIAEKNLSTPIPDVISVSKKLSELGFNVYVLFDATKTAMSEAIKKFCSYATKYETALVYYAGHGKQIKLKSDNGNLTDDTYLIPVDAIAETPYDVKQSLIATKQIVSFLNRVQTLKTRLIMIDACRTTNIQLVSRGEDNDNVLDVDNDNVLNTDELEEGIVVYSTKHGYEAYDEDGGSEVHSPFASAVIKHIATPKVSVSDFITDITYEVKSLTSVSPYPHPQEPRSIPTITHRFFFNPVRQEQTEMSFVNRLSDKTGGKSDGDLQVMAISDPTTPEAFYETGMSFYQQKDYAKAVSWFMKSAAANYAPAQAILGVCYQEGEGVNKDYGIARDYYEKAAKKNNAKAINGLGRLYEHGLGVEKNMKKAIKYFERAARLGYGAGYYNLGMIYSYINDGVMVDQQKAFEMFNAGAELKHSGCMTMLGQLYEIGLGVEANIPKAIEYYNQGIELGEETCAYLLGILYRDGKEVVQDPELAAKLFAKCESFENGQYELALCYRDGFGVDKNLKRSAELFTKAAEQGLSEAQYELGNCYLYGRGVEKNEKKAVMWNEKAALQGNALAQNTMGYLYSNGYGVVQNYNIANNWFRKAADQGYGLALCNLGVSYEKGLGVQPNNEEALKYYTKAANQGSMKGQYQLGLCYAEGKGVDKNSVEALRWYIKAANQGLAEAQYHVGVCYENGKGVFNKDITKALEWYEKAAAQNYQDAIIARDRLKGK